MLLQRLAEYADQLEREGKLPPTMYQELDIRYVIQLDTLRNEARCLTLGAAKEKRGIPKLAPHILKTSGIKSRLLAENGEYALGNARQGSDPEKVRKRHEEFVRRVREAAEATRDSKVQAVAAFFDRSGQVELTLPDNFDPSLNVTFEVDGVYPMLLPSVREFWAKAADLDVTEPMQCLVCGAERPAVKTLPIQLHGIPGGQTSGMALISTNAQAFESYGLGAKVVAPTCENCG